MEKVILSGNNPEILKSKIWINLNYLLGCFAGNNRVAMRKYKTLVDELMIYCTENKIPFYIMGPAVRTNVSMEKIISKRLDKFMKKRLAISKDDIISGSDLEKDGQQLFQKNGIHANEFYHDLIAERIIDKLSNRIENENQ
jgi:hypothetical protein